MYKVELLNQTVNVSLKDGCTVAIRLLRENDLNLMKDFFINFNKRDELYFYLHLLDPDYCLAVTRTCETDSSLRLIAVNDKGIAGYVYASPVDIIKKPRIYKYGACVRKEMQNKGLGSLLTQKLLELCKTEDISKIHLTVHKSNSKAITLYKKCGFKISGDRINQRQGLPQWKMRWDNDPSHFLSSGKKNEIKLLKIIIAGKVQNVGFRNFVKKHADALGVDGWVRNCSDCSVEAVFSGRVGQVDQLIELCHKGPINAVVENFKIQKREKPVKEGFKISKTKLNN